MNLKSIKTAIDVDANNTPKEHTIYTVPAGHSAIIFGWMITEGGPSSGLGYLSNGFIKIGSFFLVEQVDFVGASAPSVFHQDNVYHVLHENVVLEAGDVLTWTTDGSQTTSQVAHSTISLVEIPA